MSSPMETSKAAMKRMGRYLIGHKRMVYTYPFQRAEGIDVYSDTDWSGCPRTRRSTSGGCIMIGKHCIRTWSSTQPSVTLSSGEAEFYGLVKAAGAGLGHQSLMKDVGMLDWTFQCVYGLTPVQPSGLLRGRALAGSDTLRPTLCGYRKRCVPKRSR